MLVSVILPTYNEKDNILILIKRLEMVLKDHDYEIIVVDDNSPDRTWEVVMENSLENKRIRLIRRMQAKGLASAIVEGFASAAGEFLIVLDADLQHDEKKIPDFIHEFKNGADIVIGTRKKKGGRIENWTLFRKMVSGFAGILARMIVPQRVSDPMSGFFGVTSAFFQRQAEKLNPRGFKILLELLHFAGDNRIAEVGYTFSDRQFGQSKLSKKVVLDYLVALYNLKFGKIISLRFIKYAMVGASGVLVNQSGLWLGKYPLAWKNEMSLLLGIELSIVTNFILNNYWTFRHNRLQGPLRLMRGFIFFNSICLAGAFINFVVALYLTEKLSFNIFMANMAGILLGTFWNYFINVQITWKSKRKLEED